MKPFRWSSEKNRQLKIERGVSFEQMVVAMDDGGLLDILEHPNPAKYPKQKVLVVRSDGYAYLVPIVEASDHVFLKTVIPSRKADRKPPPAPAGLAARAGTAHYSCAPLGSPVRQ